MEAFYTSVTRYGSSILYCGYENGIRVREKVKFRPELFVPTRKGTDWKSIYNEPLERIEFGSIREARDFIDSYAGMPDFKVHGMTRWPIQFIQRKFPNDIKFNMKVLNVLSYDLEVYSGNGFPEPQEAKEEITLISTKSSKSDKRIIWGTKAYDPALSEHSYRTDIEYRQFRSEREMLINFVEWFSHPDNCPDIITGWNTRTFDTPYLINRLINALGDDWAKRLSPWKKVDQKSVLIKGRPMQTYQIAGVSELDYLDLFVKFGNQGPQENYKLDNIAYVVLGDAKLNYDEYDTIHGLYENNFQKFVDYGLKDVDLIDRFEEKLGLISLTLTFAYMAGVNYNDTLGTVALWDSIVFRALMKRHVAVPPGEDSDTERYEGGFVKEPQTGRYGWVCSLDVASMYPNLLVQYNMSPETYVSDTEALTSIDDLEKGIVPKCDRSDVSIAANGACFRKDKLGIIPELVAKLYDERVQAKKNMLDCKKKLEAAKTSGASQDVIQQIDTEITLWSNVQMAKKICINSVYGALGSRFFRYYNLKIAEGITLSGQLLIQKTSGVINGYITKMTGVKRDYILMNDTDSAAFLAQPVVDKFKPDNVHDFLVEFVQRGVLPALEKAYSDLGDLMNAYDKRMVIKLESVASSAVFLAKKKYMMHVISSEGVMFKEPKMKITGVSAIQSSTPECCRKALREIIKLILVGTEEQVQNKIAEFRDSFDRFSPEDIAFPRGVSDIDTYRSDHFIYKSKEELRATGKKSIPINSRAALIYNYHVKRNGLHKKYDLIRSGDKIKYLYLMIPNEIRENVIAFSTVLPRELNIHKYVDYKTQFEKAYLSLVVQILDTIGWRPEKIASIDDFFA